MPEPGEHIIRKSLLDLHLDRQENAFAQQKQISELFQAKVLPVLAEEFDRLGLGKDVLSIPQLEIDLGPISPDQLDTVFVERCIANLKKVVMEKYRHFEAGISTGQEEVEQEGQLLFRALISFLANGRLIPAVRKQSWSELEENWIRNVIKEQEKKLVATVRDLLPKEPQILRRLILQFSPDFWSELCLAAVWDSKELKKEVQQLIHFLAADQAALELSQKSIRVLYQQLLGLLFSNKQESEKKQALHFLSRQIKGILTNKTKKPGKISLKQPVDARINRSYANEQLEDNEPLDPHEKFDQYFQTLEQDSKENIGGSNELPSNAPGESLDLAGEWIDNAGLILLHPFLPAFFQQLQLLEKKAFIGKEQCQRAIYLLHYLVTAQETAREYELLFPKILCGWPVKMPVEKEWQLSPLEKSEADDLLKAVLQHWDALKSTSAEALQQGFLQRSGMIRYRGNVEDWWLQVERKSLDILLERIPWGYAKVKLPWLEHFITVEW